MTLIDRFLDHESHMRLMASCDAYVSLHRSEGFGQGMAEAMLLGKPVIATAYSGNLSFMNTHNSALVPAGRVALGPQDYPYGQGQQWAQPDLDAAAVLMRRAVRDPAWCAEMGRRARADVLQTNGPGVCARALRDAVLAMERRA
jgi:glycosyltransferase involved in cell wall biosynthesis